VTLFAGSAPLQGPAVPEDHERHFARGNPRFRGALPAMTVADIHAWKADGVVALGLGGNEVDNPPFGILLQEGLLLTVNSDDPAMFNTTLTDELSRVSQSHGLGVGAIEMLTLNAIQASCLTGAAKAQLAAEFHASFAALREDHGVA